MIPQIVLAHMVGDYLLQSHWMATEKTKHWVPAILHGIMYTLPFLLITLNVPALLIIAGTHVLIDHYRLARYLGWFKNLFGPRTNRASITSPTGYPEGTPEFLAFWLMIITDNLLHILIAIAAIGILA